MFEGVISYRKMAQVNSFKKWKYPRFLYHKKSGNQKHEFIFEIHDFAAASKDTIICHLGYFVFFSCIFKTFFSRKKLNKDK